MHPCLHDDDGSGKAFLNPYHTHNNGTNCTDNSWSMPRVTQPLSASSTHFLLRLRVLMVGAPMKCAKPSSAWKAVIPTTSTLELTLTLPVRALRGTICLEHVTYSHIATSASCLVSTTKLHVSDGLDLGSDCVHQLCIATTCLLYKAPTNLNNLLALIVCYFIAYVKQFS